MNVGGLLLDELLRVGQAVVAHDFNGGTPKVKTLVHFASELVVVVVVFHRNDAENGLHSVVVDARHVAVSGMQPRNRTVEEELADGILVIETQATAQRALPAGILDDVALERAVVVRCALSTMR